MPSKLVVGTMLEVPALAWQMTPLLTRVQFVSIGSNDLQQFLFASDRANPRVWERYDVLSPPVLCFLREVVGRCRAAGVPVSVCGEMAGRTLDAMALIGLGIHSISMSAASIGPIKSMVRSLEVGPLREYMACLFDAPDHSVRDKLRLYAQDHGVVL